MSSTGRVTYKIIDDIHAYVQELEEKGAKVLFAQKFARVLARKGVLDEKVISWSVDANGNALVEKEACVTSDAETGELDWIVTKADTEGRPVMDQNGHINEWIITDRTFRKKYEQEQDSERSDIYKPAGGVQKFIRVSEAVCLQQWGETWKIDAGGYVNITNSGDYYVISGRDFEDTYRVV